MEAFGDWLLDALPHVVLVLFVLGGVVGSAVPAFPGAVLILAGSLIHGFWTGWEPLGLWVQLVLVVLTIISWGVQYVVAAYGAKRYGASNWGVFGAAVGMIVGLFIPVPILGPLIGAFCGALAFEVGVRWIRAQQDPPEPNEADTEAEVEQATGEAEPERPRFDAEEGRKAAKAGFGAALGAVVGLMAELGVAIGMAGVIGTAFLFSWIF
jgi:uncharacterized protein